MCYILVISLGYNNRDGSLQLIKAQLYGVVHISWASVGSSLHVLMGGHGEINGVQLDLLTL